MAGYSGTPLPKKLGIKSGHAVAVLGAASGEPAALLASLPPDVAITADLVRGMAYDVILFFTESRAELERRFGTFKKALNNSGGLWICWPKKSSKVVTDLTEDVVREIALAAGLVDNKVCAVDETWSGLRLVYRLADRPKVKS